MVISKNLASIEHKSARMGCSSSKLEDEEAVQLCNDRRNFVKQAVEQRYRFALSHISYMESLNRVSLALLRFVERNEHHDFMDRYSAPHFSPDNHWMSADMKTSHVVNCLRSSSNHASIHTEEWIGIPETIPIQSLSNLGDEGFFTYNPSQSDNSSFFTASPYNINRPISYPPLSPQNSQRDYFWNPFSLLNQYTYQSSGDDDDEEEILSVRMVREREGIPDLEEVGAKKEGVKINTKSDEGGKDNKDEEKLCEDKKCDEGEKEKAENVDELKEYRTRGADSSSIEVSQAQDTMQADDTPPDFVVYVDRRPTRMAEVIKDINSQFERILDASREVGVMLEAKRALYSAPTQITGGGILKPSSRSSSFRLLIENNNVNNPREDEPGEECSSNYSEECGMIAGSHQSTLERLYAWENKLYDEVKSAERIRIAYEKKCMQLRRHDANGDEPSMVDKTRSIIRDLRTQLKVSMHSVESVSQRIETLRDEELYPQLLELIQGLARMWRTIADSHGIQKQIIEEAKVLLFSSSSSTATTSSLLLPSSETNNEIPSKVKPSKHATKLTSELKYWGSSISALTNAQRSYAQALASWISRCARPLMINSTAAADPDHETASFSRRAPPVCVLCMSWSQMLRSISEVKVVEGIEFLGKGIEAVSRKQKEAALAMAGPPDAEGLAELGEKVLCAGLSEAMAPLKEFAVSAQGGYGGLARKYLEYGRAVSQSLEEE